VRVTVPLGQTIVIDCTDLTNTMYSDGNRNGDASRATAEFRETGGPGCSKKHIVLKHTNMYLCLFCVADSLATDFSRSV